MKLLESLVADKEALRKSNAELQDLLSESREALQALQEEAGERLVSSTTGRILSRDVPKSATSSTTPGPLSPISAIFSSHDNPPMFKHPVNTDPPSHRSFVGTVERPSIRPL